MKRNLKIFLTVIFVFAACFFATNSTVETQAATKNGWITRGGKHTIMKMESRTKDGLH